MSDDINVAEVDSLILRLCKEHPRFGEIIEFGLANGLNISNPVEFSKTPKGCKLLFALNYVPTRHDNQHPSIATIIRIVCIILKGSLGYTKEAAEQFLESEVAIADRSPFEFEYAFIHANKANKDWYKRIQAMTDPINLILWTLADARRPNPMADMTTDSQMLQVYDRT